MRREGGGLQVLDAAGCKGAADARCGLQLLMSRQGMPLLQRGCGSLAWPRLLAVDLKLLAAGLLLILAAALSRVASLY